MPSELKSNWPQILSATTQANASTLLAQGEVMKFRLIGQLYAPKGGRIYGTHQASAPGESPASFHKALEGSIMVEPQDAGTIAGSTPPQVSVGTNLDYAQTLEFGGGRIAPRPNFAPRGDEMAPEVTNALTAAIKTAIDTNALK